MTSVQEELRMRVGTDSDIVTFSESCVRSDIANIITKIYSPRPLAHHYKASGGGETAGQAGDTRVGGNEEGKRFGFYFEPVTRRYAKTFVDSSTASGSVSLPVVRFKPKRLRRVCDCCRRRVPLRDHEPRAKRGCRNHWSDAGHSSTTAGPRGEGRRRGNPAGDEVQARPSGSLKTIQEVDTAKHLLKRSSTHSQPCTGNELKRSSTQVRFDCSPVKDGETVNDTTANKQYGRTHEFSNKQDKKVKSPSFLLRVISKIFSKNDLDNVVEEDTQKLRHVQVRYSKSSVVVEKEVKRESNNNILRSHKSQPSVHSINRKRSGSKKPSQTLEIDLSKVNSTTEHSIPCKVVSHVESELDSVYSTPEPVASKSKNKFKDERILSDIHLDCNVDTDSAVVEVEDVCDRKSKPAGKRHKYEPCKGLRIEKDVDWAHEFWGKVFGTCHSAVSFFTSFLLHLLTFVLQSVVQPLVFGTLRVSSDHCFQPCLATALHSVILPVGGLVEGLAKSLRDICQPVGQCVGVYCREVSHVCRACRVVEINKNYYFHEEP